jgi:hypothetical protein
MNKAKFHWDGDINVKQNFMAMYKKLSVLRIRPSGLFQFRINFWNYKCDQTLDWEFIYGKTIT